MNYNLLTNIENLLNKQEKEQNKNSKKEKILKEAFLNIFKTKEAKIIFQFIKDLSLWDVADENINSQIIQYKKGRRDMWLILRTLLPKDILAEIEIYNKYEIGKGEKNVG